jgi:hypothetical protein
MEVSLNKYILAIVTIKRDKVAAGVPIFYCDSEEEKEQVASNLTRITNGMVHDIGNGVYIIVRH